MICKKICSLIATLVIAAALPACSGSCGQSGSLSSASASDSRGAESVFSASSTGQIYLYGEEHGVKKILDKEFQLWHDDYNDEGMRHLFIELPYYTAEFLNVWMRADNDTVLDAVYDDWDGTAAHTPDVKAFYQKIKTECPETVFHGTDVGHQYDTTGERFLQYLEENGEKDLEQYQLVQQAIHQGEVYYGKGDDVYRENKMVENFIREFDHLNGESVMGIYGSAHTRIDAMDYSSGTVPCMANQLNARYGSALHSEDISWIAKDIDPVRVDTVTVAGCRGSSGVWKTPMAT